MDPGIDSATREQVEEFRRRMAAMRYCYKAAISMLTAEQARREAELIQEPSKLQQRLSVGRQLFARASSQLWQKLNPRTTEQPRNLGGQSQAVPRVIIIDVTPVDGATPEATDQPLSSKKEV